MLAVKKFRSEAKGLPDLLNYAAVIDDGIILNKDGSLMAGWFYRGVDSASSTNQEKAILSAKVSAALTLGTGWMSNHDCIRTTAKEYPAREKSFFPDKVTQWIDDERRNQFQAEEAHYESNYVLVLTYLPPHKNQSKVTDLMFDQNKEDKQQTMMRTLDYFKQKLNEVEDRLSAVIKMQRMRGIEYEDEFGELHVSEQLLQYLNFCITGRNHPINLPPVPMYIDCIIGTKPFFPGLTPKIDDQCISVISIDGFPQESFPGILSRLDALPIPYRWSNRFIYLDHVESIEHLKKYRRKWKQKVRGWFDQLFKTNNDTINQDALDMVNETDAAIAEASSELVNYGYYTSVVVIMEKDLRKLEEYTRYARAVIENKGFATRVENINANEAWLGSLPGHSLPNVRRPLIHTLNLSDILPLSAVWTGRDYNPCPYYPPESPPLLHAATEGSTPFRLNLHVSDTGHTLIFGPTGSGKSTLLGILAAQFRRYKNSTVIAFDKKYSLLPLTLAVNGTHYDIAGDGSSLSFCPLKHINSASDIAWADEWIATLLELQGVVINPRHRTAIHQAMLQIAEADTDQRSLTDFVTNVQDQELREALTHYTVSGAMGHLLDAQDDNLDMGTFFTTFEIEELMNLGEKNLIPVLLYLFFRIKKMLKGQPGFLSLDEAWIMLGHKVFRDKIVEWLKELRKNNVLVILSTQSLSDARNSGILDILQESCPTKIFLPNPTAMNEEPYYLYKSFGLNHRQIEIIQNATPKRHYYYTSPEGFRLFDLNLGPLAKAFVASSSQEETTLAKNLYETHGKDWIYPWLETNKVDYEKFS